MKKIKAPISIALFLVVIFQNSCAVINFGSRTEENPANAKLITSDIDHFYEGFDLAIQDTSKAGQIFKKFYFERGSKGLNDFFKTKIQSVEEFSEFVLAFKDYYQSIRNDISNLKDLENEINLNFQKFENLYPPAKFPDVYFLIGKYRSNGTISGNGLLIGTEILARTPHSDTAAWNRDILKISMRRNHIPVTVSHELVHFNQDNMKKGNTLLWKSIREGSAEFIAELISGETDANYEEFEGMEWKIWKEFQEDKNKKIWKSWQQESDLRPRNAGYWMGYTICRAYFHKVGDKEKAVKDILSIKDYSEFLEKSEVEKYLQKNF